MEKDILIGSHVSMSGPKYYLRSVQEALSYEANVLMIYTGAPQNSTRTPLEKCKIEEGISLAKQNNMAIDKFICHAPYIINLANPDAEKQKFSQDILINEIKRTAGFKIKYLVLHPGLHVGIGDEAGLKNIIDGLNSVLKSTEYEDVIICIETMAGKGSELGITFEQVSKIIEGCNGSNRLGVCLDTCHINDAGYDVSNIDEVLSKFDSIIGLDRLKVIHLNDSKNLRGARKDRHENIGFGTIGFDNLLKYVFDERLKDVPKILETPYFNKKPPYKDEIKMIKEKKFNKDLFKDY